MAIIYDYRIQFLFAFFILLVILLIYPVRAETAWNNPEVISVQESLDIQNNNPVSISYKNLIMNKLRLFSCMKKDGETFFPGKWLKCMKIDVRTSTAEPAFKHVSEDETEENLAGSLHSSLHPLVEISYSLNETIALEITGRFTRHMSSTSTPAGIKNDLYGYSLMVGPSFHVGRVNENTSMYTQLGLGYKFIDTDSYTLPGDCPSTFGTGLCFGLKTSRSDIRVGVNRFRSFSEDALYRYNYDNTLDPSLMFFLVTYNFDS